ncbi:hypothetical protein GCM10023193_22850 [Planotetraspora kaengkrachanensis]|uniref:Uncharacterized protein n=1 Tax=Planotetraspora kaengkrachanensis TaxID=575193 RepID=A0A8J3LWZ7_9ACTN|nr:hypothetical protein Pka01_31290 [Planotetraspora kaengkrachanensis]
MPSRLAARWRLVCESWRWPRRPSRRFYRAERVDDLLATPLVGRPSKLDPYKAHRYQRWNEGCTNVLDMHREIAGLGYRGSYSSVRDHLAPSRDRLGERLHVSASRCGLQASTFWLPCFPRVRPQGRDQLVMPLTSRSDAHPFRSVSQGENDGALRIQHVFVAPQGACIQTHDMARMISTITEIQHWNPRLFTNSSTDGAQGRCSAHGKSTCALPAVAYVALSDAGTDRKEWGACSEWLATNEDAVEYLAAHPLE